MQISREEYSEHDVANVLKRFVRYFFPNGDIPQCILNNFILQATQ